MLEREDKLRDVEPRPVFRETGFPLQMPEELATALEVGDEIEVQLCLEAELQADQERTLQRSLENFALADGVRDLLLRHDLLLGEHLHCIYALCVTLSDLENAPERPAPHELEEFKIARR